MNFEELFQHLIQAQQKRLMACASKIVPTITADDLLQPNDFPALENHPYFRYEEGVLEGLKTAEMAFLALQKESQKT